jgi:hypothetical protein
MGRGTGKNARVAKKKRVKVTKAYQSRLGLAGESGSGKKAASAKSTAARVGAGTKASSAKGAKKGKRGGAGKVNEASAVKQRSLMLKRHAKEQMVLKHHLRELADRKAKIVRGQNARMERRELGKYMRQLKEEQLAKHAAERGEADAVILRAQGRTAELDRLGQLQPKFADDEDTPSDDADDDNDANTDDDTPVAAGDVSPPGTVAARTIGVGPTGAAKSSSQPSAAELRQMFANLL